MDQKTCGFCVEVLAPDGLERVEPYLGNCLLPLRGRVSGYNGQVILYATSTDGFDWDMDPSNTEKMFGSGAIDASPEQAWIMVSSLSRCLTDAGYPHQILLDDHGRNLFARVEHELEDLVDSERQSAE
jgi:hypothetical protein